MTDEQKTILNDLESNLRKRMSEVTRDFTLRCMEINIPPDEHFDSVMQVTMQFPVCLLISMRSMTSRQCAQYAFDIAEQVQQQLKL